MTDLSTTYMGLRLPSPLIVGSSRLTQSLDGVRRAAEAGAGAVVLKSLFEEQIAAETAKLVDASGPTHWHPEAAEYIATYGKENAVGEYLDLIAAAKKAVPIPVIASVHCVSAGSWTDFARRAEQVGADALELNVFVMSTDPKRDGRAAEQVTADVLAAVKGKVRIPVSLKIGYFFSSMATTLTELGSRADGLVLFNRFYSPDIDIEQLKLTPARFLSHPDEIALPLRWIAILSGRVKADLAASTGIHDGAGAVKQLLAGAAAVQVCSALYQHGVTHMGSMIAEIRSWMERHGFERIGDFRGRLSQARSENPAAYERVQFMKTSVGIE